MISVLDLSEEANAPANHSDFRSCSAARHAAEPSDDLWNGSWNRPRPAAPSDRRRAGRASRAALLLQPVGEPRAKRDLRAFDRTVLRVVDDSTNRSKDRRLAQRRAELQNKSENQNDSQVHWPPRLGQGLKSSGQLKNERPGKSASDTWVNRARAVRRRRSGEEGSRCPRMVRGKTRPAEEPQRLAELGR